MNKIFTEDLSKTFITDGIKNSVLRDINFSISQGETCSIIGASGCGKSTFLHLLAKLDDYSSGKIFFNEINYSDLNSDSSASLRLDNFGFVYQFHHLLKEFTSIENVALGSMILGENKKRSLEKASDILDKFGLAERLNHFPSQLSGGEKQRVAMARALINKPDLIFLDEPTGNLDKDTSREVINYLNQLADEFKSSIIVATHDPEFRNFSDKILTMDSGVFV